MESGVTHSPAHGYISTGSRAHQLAKMRVPHSGPGGCSGGKLSTSPATPITPATPVTPATPIAVTTPSYLSLSNHTCFEEECMHQDLQLAAELGKTLLERNRSLEATIKQQQTIIDDRKNEIDYLSKHSTALKAVNESRIRIYEQLEISIHELEKTNQRLTNEAAADKRKLRSLQNTIDSLEIRNDELQRALDEARGAARSRLKKKAQAWDEALLRRSVSCEHSAQEDRQSGDEDSEAVVESLTAQIKELHTKLVQEANKREEVEIELSALAQEHGEVLRHVAELREQQQAATPSLRDELDALDDAVAASEGCSKMRCAQCLRSAADTSSNPTVYDLSESIEDEGDLSQASEREGYLVRLPNGATAWGSQESLASMGQVISQVNSIVTSPATDASDAPPNSLLYELEGVYRVLIERYESLVQTREEQIREDAPKTQEENDRNCSSVEAVEMSGPMSLVLTDGDSGEANVPRKCQHCSTCSCGITGPNQRPKSNMEEFSEVETSSSGFSEGESRLSNKTTQTEWVQLERIDETTPVVETRGLNEVHFLDLKSPINPCDKRFQTTPGYGKLFKEMFTVLKKSVDENAEVSDCEHAPSHTAMSEVSVSSSKLNESTCTITEDDSAPASVDTSSKCDENTVESVASVASSEAADTVNETANTVNETAVEAEKMPVVANNSVIYEEDEASQNVKPLLRPNSLDLSNHSTRSSSRQRKQKRQPKSKAELALLKQVEQNAADMSKLGVKAVIAPPKIKPNSRPEKSKTEIIDREAPPKIIGSNVDLMGLCERHRQLQNKRKNKKNRSRNGSKPRSRLQITSLDELSISDGGEVSVPKAEVLKHKPSCGFSKTSHHFLRHQDKLSAAYGDSTVSSASKHTTQLPKINLPSIEVARLRELEMSYAQVLKAQIERSANRRAM